MINLNHPMEGRCNAKNRRGQPCRKFPIDGRTRCANHGGKTLMGKENGRYRTGKYTKENIQKYRELRMMVKAMKELLKQL